MRILLLLFIVLSAFRATAQDTLKMKDGSVLAVRIIYSDQKEIRFKRANDPKGPEYIEKAANVSELHFKSGGVTKYSDATPPASPANTAPNSAESAPANAAPAASESVLRSTSQGRMDTQDLFRKYRHMYRQRLGGGIAMMVIGAEMTSGGLWMLIFGTMDLSTDHMHGNTNDKVLIGCGVVMIAGAASMLAGGSLVLKQAIKYKQITRQLKASLAVSPAVTPIHTPTGGSLPGFGLALQF